MSNLQSVIDLELKLTKLDARLRAVESILNTVQYQIKNLERKK